MKPKSRIAQRPSSLTTVVVILVLGVVATLTVIATGDRDPLGAWSPVSAAWAAESRGERIARNLSAATVDAIDRNDPARLQPVLELSQQEHDLTAVGVCTRDGALFNRSSRFPASLGCDQALPLSARTGPQLQLDTRSLYVAVVPLSRDGRSVASLVLLDDRPLLDEVQSSTERWLITVVVALGLGIALLTGLLLRRHADLRPASGTAATSAGPATAADLGDETGDGLEPLAAELRARMRGLEGEYRRARPQPEWSPARLRGLLESDLRGDEVIVVSNREPYIHDRGPDGPQVRRPASGLVTAVEPVMRATSGTWIAHGSGSADRDTVDAHDRVGVPPGRDEYRLRRVWMTEEEEQGYYYGFANEGLWPLCHVAHVRPVFRRSDWEAYRAINQRFADAVIEEARTDDPIVLIQDYHFALMPAMIHARKPRATIITFWHIPWPNPESFGICPWRRELLQGLLGSTILGFHTRFHCRNFIETVDRYLEARIEHEHSTITFRKEETLVESYPISIAWPDAAESATWPSVAECRERVLDRLKLPADTVLAVGVDRFDYTKGILERLRALERLLDKYPDWQGRFTLVQVAAPTRGALDDYRDFQERIERFCARLNERYGRDGYRPVILLAEHHEPDQLNELFRAANLCVVTSLHDGMNLVSKEFVAARDDDAGVLVLSRYAGAARELAQALLVNPYDVEETADSLNEAAIMPLAEQRERMASLRTTVREFNVYRWAGEMLIDANRRRTQERIAERLRRHRAQAGDADTAVPGDGDSSPRGGGRRDDNARSAPDRARGPADKDDHEATARA